MSSIISLDIETTGLDPQKDTIIEIGAVRFNGPRVEDEWSTLINPNRHIPENITQLTGIDDAMVRNAPRLQDVLEELQAFAGDLPVLGQNVRFDLGFLQKQRVLMLNEVVDTYEMASVLLPTASRYNLGALGQLLGIPLPATHRALDDARVTHGVYVRLLEQAVELPLELIAEIVRLGEPLDWDGNYAFKEALKLRAKEQVKGKRVPKTQADEGPLFDEQEPARKGPPPGPVSEPVGLDPDEVASVLEYGGPFSQYFEAYEQRPEQVAMLRAVTDSLSYGHHLMVEAGTGVGKCLTGDAWVTFKDGARRQIGEIVRQGLLPADPILSVDQKGKLFYQKIQALHRNGVRPVWELRTGLGHKIKATANHPFLTMNGWRQLGELGIGDRIAAVRRIPIGSRSYPDHETFIAGAMLGDGGCGHPDALSFTNFDPEVVEAFRQNVEKLGNVQLTHHKAAGHYGFRRLSLAGHERSGLNLLLESLDILGRDARIKNIPAAYFLADQNSVCWLLAGLWVTDGCIEQGTGNISFSSASERLVSDIQHLLLRLGVISRTRYKSVLLHEKRFDSWHLSILDVQSKRLFAQTVGRYMVGKRKQRLDAWHEAQKNRKYNPNDDLFPIEAWDTIDRARTEAGKSWYAIRNASVISSDRTREISRSKMSMIGEFLSSPALVDAATSDIYWDRVVAIEPVGQAETFDLTMDGEPNFVANDIVVHNSFAYLVPAALFAIQNNTRVVVSTNTINLQDQLIQKDIPDLRAALGLELRAAVLKGRSNYLCPRRLELMRHHGADTPDEMRVIAKLLVWTQQSASGDRNELNLNRPQEKEAWMKFSAEDEACSTENCMARMGGTCPFHRARQAAQNAHILIVNHALLLSDVATGSKVLPEYQYLIVDEAHHLESATTGALSFRMSQNDFERLLREVGGTGSGVLGHLLTETRDVLRPSDYASFTQLVHRASEMTFRLDSQSKDFFYGLAEFIALQREGRPQGLYAYQERILPHTRTAQGWDNVELGWNTAGDTLRLLIGVIGEIYKGVGELYANGVDELEDPLGNLSNLFRRLTEAETSISSMIHEPSNDLIYWIEVQPQNKRLTLNHAPLRVGPLIQKYLWHEKDCVILTSATLTAAGDFTYLRNVLMAEEADELTLGSPFDYESSTLLFIANDIPEPNAPGYENAINRGLVLLARATGGRALVLFTSYAQLKRTSQAISGALAREDIQVFEQGEGASPQALLEAFKTSERAVLLGTRSFWEGVDVPGDTLSAVVITKLPFEVPSDPLVAARSETFEDPFGEYQIPEAILKFRQGFGRLIRSASDRGVVAIFDRRVLTKMYGKLFIASLPTCTLRQGTINDLPKLAEKWLG